MISSLSNIRILCDLDERSVSSISHYFHVKAVQAGEAILTEQDDEPSVIALCEGQARATHTATQGKQILLRNVQEGELFGDWTAIDEAFPAVNLIAQTDCVVAFITTANFRSLLTHNASVAMRQMQQLTGHLREMNTRITELLSLKANQRIQRVLLELATQGQHGDHVVNLPTHQEIAIRANTQREVVARELSKLQSQGFLVKQKSGYLIHRMEELGRLGGLDNPMRHSNTLQ